MTLLLLSRFFSCKFSKSNNNAHILYGLFLGLIVGAIIRYSGTKTQSLTMNVFPPSDDRYNASLPPDTLTLHFPVNTPFRTNKTYQYNFRGAVDVTNKEIDMKVTFDPEIFFNIILPPIIFHAGYSLKRVSGTEIKTNHI